MRPGDAVIVWKLDRLGRSLKDLIETLNILKDRGVDFISLTEKIDTTTPGGKLIFHLMGALAEFERDLIRERTNAGLAAARARGRVGGRPKKLMTNGKVALTRQLFADPNQSISEICSTLEISRSTLYRYVRDAKGVSKPSDPPASLYRNFPQNFGIYSMPKRATALHLSEKEQEELTHLTRRHRSEQQVVMRARIILAAAQGASNSQIAREWSINVDTVRLWRDRWAR